MARQLTREERERISQLHFAGASQAQIGRALGRHHTTIGRELMRNGEGDRYSAHLAHERALERRRRRPRARKMDQQAIQQAVRAGLARYWSPDEISGRLRLRSRHDRAGQVCAQTIYRWIVRHAERAYWESRLRLGPGRKEAERRGKLKARAEISGRPRVVDERSRFGDWEGDTVVGRQRLGGVLTLVERKSGFALAGPVKRLKARHVRGAFERLTDKLPGGLKHTLTFDNGKEFAEHERMSRRSGFDIYFARPYHAWERGSNEHFNRLLRQYFPKGTDFSRISPWEIRSVLQQLNDRPRKRHGYRTPREVLGQYFPCAFEM